MFWSFTLFHGFTGLLTEAWHTAFRFSLPRHDSPVALTGCSHSVPILIGWGWRTRCAQRMYQHSAKLPYVFKLSLPRQSHHLKSWQFWLFLISTDPALPHWLSCTVQPPAPPVHTEPVGLLESKTTTWKVVCIFLSSQRNKVTIKTLVLFTEAFTELTCKSFRSCMVLDL